MERITLSCTFVQYTELAVLLKEMQEIFFYVRTQKR